ncbi:hypothetical protein Bbelb_327460 [Branchiostoma belcheri]|nr:hypothetical protein Bbelb_327460 [Branchiostoma belcheri]
MKFVKLPSVHSDLYNKHQPLRGDMRKILSIHTACQLQFSGESIHVGGDTGRRPRAHRASFDVPPPGTSRRPAPPEIPAHRSHISGATDERRAHHFKAFLAFSCGGSRRSHDSILPRRGSGDRRADVSGCQVRLQRAHGGGQ